MFLQQLNDSEKKIFINLAIYIAKSNGTFAEEEKHMIEDYCREMDMVYIDSGELVDYEKAYKALSNSSDKAKKIIYLELLGLAYADGFKDDVENSVIGLLAEKINLNKEDIAFLNGVFLDYAESCKCMFDAISE